MSPMANFKSRIMSKTIKYILIGAFVLGVIALFIFNDNLSMGAIIAGIAGLFATIKSRLINAEPLSERIEAIETEHGVKRQEWDQVKEEYNSKFRAIKARMDYLDYRSAKISEQINDLDAAELDAIESNNNLSDEEILERLRNF
jgi:hypothetical protein